MKEIIILAIISGLVFIIFLVTLIVGLTRKNNKFILPTIFLFVTFIGFAACTGFKFVSKTYNKITETLKPRTGDEIYVALFGKQQTPCVKIINYQDQIVPKIDYEIWIYFETCPSELNRILSLHDFKTEIVSTNGWNTSGSNANNNWFKPETLGDSVNVSIYNKDEYGNQQYIYSSLDSTKVFVKDILD